MATETYNILQTSNMIWKTNLALLHMKVNAFKPWKVAIIKM